MRKVAPAAIVAPPTFTVHGEFPPRAISALARILIDHARREIEAEATAIRAGGRDGDQAEVDDFELSD
jgi:hypothetical protein